MMSKIKSIMGENEKPSRKNLVKRFIFILTSFIKILRKKII